MRFSLTLAPAARLPYGLARAKECARSTPALDPRWQKGLLSALALVLSALVLARTIAQANQAPALNWDMLPAMALALAWEENDQVEVHRSAYQHARDELAPETFRELTAPGVRQARSQDPAAFHEHLAFYRARVLYTLAVLVLYKLGAPLAAATWQVSLGAYALSSVLFALWARRRMPLALASIFALGIAHTPGLLKLASYSTADGMATFLLCLGAYLLVERRAFPAAALVFTLSILARPDSVILIFFLALALFLFEERERRPGIPALAGWLALSAAAYLAVQRFAGEYGWWPLFTTIVSRHSGTRA